MLTSFFTLAAVKGTTEGKSCRTVYIERFFIATFINWATGNSWKPKLTTVCTVHLESANHFMFSQCGSIDLRMPSYKVKQNFKKTKVVGI